MDLSPLIFVAIAIAWGAYLIPKALEHHDAGARTRTISTFSERMRVLARREAVSRRRSTLVTTKAATEGAETEAPAAERPVAERQAAMPVEDLRPVEVIVSETLNESILETTQSGRLHLPSERPAVRRDTGPLSAAGVAARRRRRVLGVLVFLFAATAAIAVGHVIAWPWLILPTLLVAGWLVACRMMVTGERARRTAPVVVRRQRTESTATVVVHEAVTTFTDDDTTSIPAIVDEAVEAPAADAAGTWEPVQAPLPTYVSKDVAPRRTVTIDLDSTGVWTSGPLESDSAIAREAREADAARAQAEQAPIKRASGA
ncbi:hypothetical protein [Nocardioides sp.]|uniref:divisome protein SepX/GlpR n=1 Tax=Nocardioides sp. TaxID=35761 RepID=UPI0026358DAD|nr:hypothetical protein [Nocardioides sp.]